MVLKHFARFCILSVLLGLSSAAQAAFHLWQITELYSNADGSVQFIELTALTGGQQFLSQHTIVASQGGTTRTFTFPSDLPGDTSGKTMLIGTQGFAALGLVTPDYTVPNGFLFTSNGSVNFAASADVFNYTTLPTDGTLSLNRNLTTGTNSPKNFAGATSTIAVIDYTGAWYNAAENGWGLSLIRGASGAYGIIMYNYNAGRNSTWYFMSGGTFNGTTYTAPVTLYTGPAFSEPFSAVPVNITTVGTVTLNFTSATAGTMTYTISGVTVTKSITKIQF